VFRNLIVLAVVVGLGWFFWYVMGDTLPRAMLIRFRFATARFQGKTVARDRPSDREAVRFGLTMTVWPDAG
jgi:hypothetical protein